MCIPFGDRRLQRLELLFAVHFCVGLRLQARDLGLKCLELPFLEHRCVAETRELGGAFSAGRLLLALSEAGDLRVELPLLSGLRVAELRVVRVSSA
jgi:hypothetical protein